MAMRAAAPPPIALNSDTSCGIAVIFTVRAAYRPAPPPIGEADQDDRPGGRADAVAVELLGEDEDRGRPDGEGHAAGRHEVAVAGGGRRVHPHRGPMTNAAAPASQASRTMTSIDAESGHA